MPRIRGKIIVDKKHFGLTGDDSAYLDAPLNAIAMDVGGKPQYLGTVSLGLLAGMFAIDFGIVERTLRSAFSSKGRDIEDRNVACALKGFEIGKKSPL